MDTVFIAYLGSGVVAYVALRFWYAKTGLDKERSVIKWHQFIVPELLFGLLVWPLAVLLALAEYRMMLSRRKRAAEQRERRMEKQQREGKYAEMSMDSLLDAQRRILSDMNQK